MFKIQDYLVFNFDIGFGWQMLTFGRNIASDKKSAEIRRNPQKYPIKYPYQIPLSNTASKNTRSYSGRFALKIRVIRFIKPDKHLKPYATS